MSEFSRNLRLIKKFFFSRETLLVSFVVFSLIHFPWFIKFKPAILLPFLKPEITPDIILLAKPYIFFGLFILLGFLSFNYRIFKKNKWPRLVRFLLMVISSVLLILLWASTPINSFHKWMYVFILIAIVNSVVILFKYENESILTKNSSIDHDAPLLNPEEDKLGRKEFSNQIYEIIKSLPDSNFRMALIGDWGTGKSTCQNFISFYASKEDFPVVNYKPWLYSNTEEAWDGFVDSIRNGISKWDGNLISPFINNKIIQTIWNIIDLSTENRIGKGLNSLLSIKNTQSLSIQKKKVSEAILSHLDGKKLIIIIDDLDRSVPEIVYEFFMLIKEVIDLENCVFICGIDVHSLDQILKDRGGIRDINDYLRKIFHWTQKLPEITKKDLSGFIDYLLKSAPTNLKKDVLIRIEDKLPQNPRSLKHYIRTLIFLHRSFLHRFGDNDLNWEFLYLAELLKFYFPSQSQLLGNSPTFFQWLVNKGMFIGRDEIKKEDKEYVQRYAGWIKELKENAPVSNEAEDRFNGIIDALANISGGKDEKYLGYHFRVLNHPEVLTWKEYEEIQKLPKEKILEFLNDTKKDLSERREYLFTLMRERDYYLEKEADAFSEESDRKQKYDKAEELTNLAIWFASQKELHKGDNPLFNATVVIEWLNYLSKWAHFKANIYSGLRKKEEELALIMADKSLSFSQEILESDLFNRDYFMNESKKAFSDTLTKIKSKYLEFLANQLINSFKTPNYIKNLWGKDKYLQEKKLLFEKNEYIFNDKNKKRLFEIISEGKNNDTIHYNVAQYMSMLFYAGLEPVNNFNHERSFELLNEDEVREKFWSIATCRRIHRRQMGELMSDRKKYIERSKKSNALPIPEWVQNEEKDLIEHFTPKIN